jgi:hypothetical protein
VILRRPADGYTILQCAAASGVWKPWFRDPQTWTPWRTFLSVLFGLSLDDEEHALYRQCTGRSTMPRDGFTEAWLICGRKAGKSFNLALIACYLAVFRDWSRYLTPGEVGTIKIIANDRRQARVIHRYCRALLTQPPALAALVERDSDDEIALTNGITIEIQTASFRTVRGYTVIAALLDEVSFWRSDDLSANPDQEILDALRPAMSTIPGAMLLAASSPYAKRGVMWQAYKEHHGKDDAAILVWHADTRTMNPTVSPALIREAYARDPQWAAAEYGAEFRSDLETFVSREVVESCVMHGFYELPPRDRTVYTAFVDPSGGSSDSMTLAIAHRQDDRAILDCIREVRPPFSPESVVEEFADTCRSYRVARVTGDRFAGEWPREQFQKRGITYHIAVKSKSDLYVAFLPLLNSRRIDLLDHPIAINQLCSLERRTGRGTGRDVIDHPPKSHDDLANVIAGVLTGCIAKRPLFVHPDVLARSALPPSPFAAGFGIDNGYRYSHRLY